MHPKLFILNSRPTPNIFSSCYLEILCIDKNLYTTNRNKSILSGCHIFFWSHWGVVWWYGMRNSTCQRKYLYLAQQLSSVYRVSVGIDHLSVAQMLVSLFRDQHQHMKPPTKKLQLKISYIISHTQFKA